MKWLFILSIVLACTVAKSQDFEGEARTITDSIFASKDHHGQSDWFTVYDSLLFLIVNNNVKSIVTHDHFTYPWWYFQGFTGNSLLPVPTETGKQWLDYRYNIRWDILSLGCIVQSAYRLHDSLMNDAIENKYGKDIFIRALKEADSLDKKRLGLVLPFIDSPVKTHGKLLKAYPFLKSLPAKNSSWRDNDTKYILFEFKNGEVQAAYLCHYVFYIQQDLEQMHLSDGLTKIARQLKWKPPMFLGKPIDRSVVWNVNTGELFFN